MDPVSLGRVQDSHVKELKHKQWSGGERLSWNLIDLIRNWTSAHFALHFKTCPSCVMSAGQGPVLNIKHLFK